MKFSVASVVAFAAVVLAKPMFTNSNYDVQEGVPITLQWSNAEGPVTVTLMTGNDPNNLKKVTDLVVDTTEASFTYTPENLPSGTYAFRITDSSGEANYSPRFQYSGTGTLTTSASMVSSASRTRTSASSFSSTTESSSSSTDSSTVSSTSTTSSESSSITSSTFTTSTTTTTLTPTTTRRVSTTTTPANSNNGQRFASPLALVLVTVAALIFFN
ncbi:hypothetical protein VTK56DRAFT_4572 [Thermocarpiscus australiensis]